MKIKNNSQIWLQNVHCQNLNKYCKHCKLFPKCLDCDFNVIFIFIIVLFCTWKDVGLCLIRCVLFSFQYQIQLRNDLFWLPQYQSQWHWLLASNMCQKTKNVEEKFSAIIPLVAITPYFCFGDIE